MRQDYHHQETECANEENNAEKKRYVIHYRFVDGFSCDYCLSFEEALDRVLDMEKDKTLNEVFITEEKRLYTFKRNHE